MGVVASTRSRRDLRPVWLVLVAAMLTSACGARTGLDESFDAAGLDAPRLDAPDAPRLDAPRLDAHDAPIVVDAPPDTVTDAPMRDGCMPVTITLTPITAEIVLVLDRSTSMGWSLTGPAGPGATRWAILGDALRMELPRWDGSSDLGLLLFPEPAGANCATSPTPQLIPTPDGSAAVLARVAGTGPGGRTPTAAAMTTARDYFVLNRDPTRPQAVVLATDGAPNCNGLLDARSCRCTNGAGLPVGRCPEPELCLDDVRAIGVIAELEAEGVPTYVIGIDGDPDPALSSVLTRLATAGGRPNPLDPGRGYYSVTRPADLGAALDRIESSIARCTLTLERPVPPDHRVSLTLDGAVVPEDGTRTNGWAWSADGSELIELFGPTCDLAQDGATHVLELFAGC